MICLRFVLLFTVAICLLILSIYDLSNNGASIYLEACEPGSNFLGLLPEGLNIYATASAKTEEDSWAPGVYTSPLEYDTCLGDQYSAAWMEDSIWGDIGLSKNYLFLYLSPNPANDDSTFLEKNSLAPPSKAVDQRDADLIHFWDKIRKTAAQKQILEVRSHRMDVDDNVNLIGKLLFGIAKSPELLRSVRPAGYPLVADSDCLKTLFTKLQHEMAAGPPAVFRLPINDVEFEVRTFESHCGSLSQYGMKHEFLCKLLQRWNTERANG